MRKSKNMKKISHSFGDCGSGLNFCCFEKDWPMADQLEPKSQFEQK